MPNVSPPRRPETSAGPGPAELAELALVAAAAAQGCVLAAWLGIFPAAALRMGGFPPAPPFFVRWAGVLQALLAAGYVLEWLRARRVALLVTAKVVTAGFLAATWIADGLPGLLVAAIAIESATAAAAALVRGPATRSRRARGRLRLVARAADPVRPAGRS